MNDLELENYANDDIAISEYLSHLDEFEIELSVQEQTDLDELNKLIQNRTQQENLSTEIWGTIKKATVDSVEQIIGLNNRGDWRPDQGAVITTPLNFREGIVASNADKKRYEMWQDRLNGNAASASEFRNDPKRFKSSYDSAKKSFKDSRRNPDGSYNNDYNDTVVYDWCDSRTYNEADTSGDMIRDTTKTINVDHVNSVKSLYEDDKMALYGGATEESFDQTMQDVANNPANFAVSDEHANKSMKDKDTLEAAESNPDLNMDPEKVKAKKAEADAAKNKCLLKNAIGEKSKELAVGIGKSTLAATGKMLVGKAMNIAVCETVVEFQQKSKDSLLDRIKRIISNIMKRAKLELSHIWQEIKEFAVNNAISEIVNLILNYFVSTVKNVFKLIRCLFGSIVSAFKIIFDSNRPWEERLFEALKIISAGIAMATGTMLNELIAKAIATNIPFLAGFASDISAVISGLISSILSALVLMSFDRYKASLHIKDEGRKIMLLNMQLTGSSVSHAQISAARANAIVAQTTELVRQELISIVEHNREIEAYINKIKESINRQQIIHDEIDQIQQDIEETKDALNQIKDKSNRIVEIKLNNLPSIDNE